MLLTLCRCGKKIFGSEAMAGETTQCPKCGRMTAFPSVPAARPLVAPTAGAGAAVAVASPAKTQAPAVPSAPPAEAPRLPCETLYWILLLTLLPLVSVLFQDDKLTPAKRLEKTLSADPALKKQVDKLMKSDDGTVEDLFDLLPNRKLDDSALLPRGSVEHWRFAGVAGMAFFVLIGVFMAWRVTSPLWLVLVAAFTASFGIAFLFILQDFIGLGMMLTLQPGSTFFSNLLGFVFFVGLGEELCKALPVIFYVRTFKQATWRGACLWGMASGVGFGVAEGVHYSMQQYHGVATADIYLVRFTACVTLHAVWSASVGITLFFSRQAVGKVIVAMTYGGDLSWGDLLPPLLRVLGVAMALHGFYDTLLTQDVILPALVVALLSFAWLGWQIEESREIEQRHNQALALFGMA